MLPQLKLIYDIINASDDGFGLPIKGIITKMKRLLFLAVMISILLGIGIGYLIFEIILV
jgi:hypothetical protein